MSAIDGSVLVLNAGSSSIKFQLFDADHSHLHGEVDGLGTEHPHLRISGDSDVPTADRALSPKEAFCHESALAVVVAWLDEALPDARVLAVGHRVVHGGPNYGDPVEVTDRILEDLERLIPLAPLHQPHNISGIRAARVAFPDARQVACFDTAFHRGHSFAETVFALPRQYYDEGVRRYGFHGVSYDYISCRLAEIAPEIAKKRVIAAHLGNGASMCAMHEGRSISSTMGFSALDGLVMGTRCGQIDPGVLLYLMQQRGMDGDAIATLLYHDSGLKGLSEISSDMRELEASDDPRAGQAIEHFVARIRRELGGLTAVLGGLDALVFTGGIGEHSRLIRQMVCAGQEWLGLAFDEAANAANADVLSTSGSAVTVLRIPTDEERMIARAARKLIRG